MLGKRKTISRKKLVVVLFAMKKVIMHQNVLKKEKVQKR